MCASVPVEWERAKRAKKRHGLQERKPTPKSKITTCHMRHGLQWPTRTPPIGLVWFSLGWYLQPPKLIYHRRGPHLHVGVWRRLGGAANRHAQHALQGWGSGRAKQ